MVDMAEVPTEALIEENEDRVLKATQEVSTIWDHIHNQVADNIKQVQAWQDHSCDRWYKMIPFLEEKAKNTTWEGNLNPSV